MLTLKDLLTVCHPDWIKTGKHCFSVERYGVLGIFLDCPVEEVSGWDDGLTIELCNDLYTSILTDTEYQLKKSILRVFSFSRVGSALHIVIDDGNVDDENIQWCARSEIPEVRNEAERKACERCAALLLQLPLRERERIIHGYGREWGLDDR